MESSRNSRGRSLGSPRACERMQSCQRVSSCTGHLTICWLSAQIEARPAEPLSLTTARGPYTTPDAGFRFQGAVEVAVAAVQSPVRAVGFLREEHYKVNQSWAEGCNMVRESRGQVVHFRTGARNVGRVRSGAFSTVHFRDESVGRMLENRIRVFIRNPRYGL